MAVANGASEISTGLPLSNGNHVNGNSSPGNLHIVIVGAGIGGLTAAIFLRRNGHQVTLLEQSRFASEVGAAVHLAPNANGLLRRLGISPEDLGANVFERMTEYNIKNEKLRDVDLAEAHSIWQHPWDLVHRVRLHEQLKKTATSPDGPGEPAILKTCSRVLDVDAAQGIVYLENGETYKHDVVIGADGVHSKTRTKVVGSDIKPFPSGQSAFRFLVPRQAAMDDPRTAPFLQTTGQLIIWYGPGRRVVMYPCDNNTLLNFVCIHPREESDPGKIEDWDSRANKSVLLNVYKDFDENLLALLDKADPESLKVWELLTMDEVPTWTLEKLALLGDSAHPFLPHQGQGAAMAIEDAAALGVVLPAGTKPEQVPGRLQLYEQCRRERATSIQNFSRLAGQDVKDKDFDMMAYTNYNCGHDEWDSASQKFRKWQWAQKPNLYWRMPVSFGPFPGPRQTVEGVPRTATHSTFTTASIKFKTSRTVLQNLFPSTCFRFKSPGTVAYASFSQTTLNKMEWLGGSGYRHIGLYIHGVQYVQKDGSVLDGTFLPILFESLTDPIVSGREELGMPKLYCTVDIWRRSNSYRIQTGWQGVQFGSLSLEGLTEGDPGASKGTIGGEDDDGIFAYKYIPKVGERGQADVEHATFVPHAEEAKVVPSKVQRVFTAKSGSVKFDPLDWESLPTLHHVITRLAEIPIYEVISGKVVEGLGVPDVSRARRID